MAFVAGFRCVDGIVVCANQQMSAPGAPQSFERNLTIMPGQSILFCYSGLSSLAREACEKIRKKIGQAEIPSSLLYLAVNEVITEMRRQYVDLDLQLLIGISAASEEPTLFRFDGNQLQVADEFNFLGAADSSLFRFLAAMMHSPQMTTEEITNLAIYLVRKAEGYIDPCGGPIDIAIMKSGDQSCRLLLEEDVQDIIRKVKKKEVTLIPLDCGGVPL
jgi:20S proteasome alpha/beta subunit